MHLQQNVCIRTNLFPIVNLVHIIFGTLFVIRFFFSFAIQTRKFFCITVIIISLLESLSDTLKANYKYYNVKSIHGNCTWWTKQKQLILMSFWEFDFFFSVLISFKLNRNLWNTHRVISRVGLFERLVKNSFLIILSVTFRSNIHILKAWSEMEFLAWKNVTWKMKIKIKKEMNNCRPLNTNRKWFTWLLPRYLWLNYIFIVVMQYWKPLVRIFFSAKHYIVFAFVLFFFFIPLSFLLHNSLNCHLLSLYIFTVFFFY